MLRREQPLVLFITIESAQRPTSRLIKQVFLFPGFRKTTTVTLILDATPTACRCFPIEGCCQEPDISQNKFLTASPTPGEQCLRISWPIMTLSGGLWSLIIGDQKSVECEDRTVQDEVRWVWSLKTAVKFLCSSSAGEPHSVRGSPEKKGTRLTLCLPFRDDHSDHRSKGGCVNMSECNVVDWMVLVSDMSLSDDRVKNGNVLKVVQNSVAMLNLRETLLLKRVLHV